MSKEDLMQKLTNCNDEINRLTNELYMAQAQLEAIDDLLSGRKVSDFMLSFGIVKRVDEAMLYLEPLIRERNDGQD